MKNKELIIYYAHMGTYKTTTYGRKINDKLAYHKIGNTKIITHLLTGMKIKMGEESTNKLVQESMAKLDDNEKLVEKIQKDSNIHMLPIKDDYFTCINHFENVFKFDMPYDLFIDCKGKDFAILDVIKLDNKLQKRKKYDDTLSLDDNILNMYGKIGLEICNYFTTTNINNIV